MINNYDSVVSCLSSGTPHSQKQESTSYTATKRNWLSFVTVLVALFCFSNVFSQNIFTDGFESGNTNQGTSISNWTQEGTNSWTANSSLTSYNRTPRTGTFNAYLIYGSSRWMFRSVELTGGVPYKLSVYARQDGSTTANAGITLKYGTVASAAGMTNSITANVGVGSSYTEVKGVFTPATTGTYFIGILGTINSSPWYLSIDDISLDVAVSPDAAPITFSASAVTPVGMTVNWVDNSTNETAFRVYRSTDNITFTQVGTDVTSTSVAGVGTAYSLPVTGLSASTTYYYRIASVVDAESAYLTGTQATADAATYYWVGPSGGNFGTAANWNTAADNTGSTRSTPAVSDILIVDGAGTTSGAATTINVELSSFTIGQFKVTSNTALTLISSATTTRTITMMGSPGDDFVIESGSTLNLTDATKAVAFAFTGTGNAGLIAGTYNAAGSTSNVITTTGGTNTLVTVASTGVVNSGLNSSSACIVGSVLTLSFADGSNYAHSNSTTVNYIPTATWGVTATARLNGNTTGNSISSGSTSLGNLIINTTASTATLAAAFSGVTIKGNLTVLATNTGRFRATSTGTLTINGDLIVSGGTFEVSSSTGTVNVLGNISLTGGVFDVAQGGASFLKVKGNFVQTGGALQQTSGTGTLEFNGVASQTFTPATVTASNFLNIRVNNSAGVVLTANLPVKNVTISLGNLTGAGLLSYNTTASLLTYNGAVAQAATATEFPSANGPVSLTINNTATAPNNVVSVPFTRTLVGTTGTLNLTAGILDNSTYVLSIPNTAASAVSAGSATAYVKGALERSLPANLSANATYTFPVGKSAFNAFELINPLTNGTAGGVVARAEVIDAATGGTAGNLISTLNTNKYWAVSTSGGTGANFTSSNIKLNDTRNEADGIARSATLTGAYDNVGGVASTVTPTSIQTITPITALDGFYVMAAKASPVLTNLAITPLGNRCPHVTRTVTVNVAAGAGAVTGVQLNYSVNGGTPVAVTMTNTSGTTWTGDIPLVTPANATVTWSVTATDANLLTKTQTGTSYTDGGLNTPIITITPSVTSFCGAGGPVTLTASSTGLPGVTYIWQPLTSGVTLSTNTGAITSANITETTDFKVIGLPNDGGCPSEAYISIGVYPLPLATVTTTASGVCPGTSATIGSGLSAGNFSSLSIPSIQRAAPSTAVTLATAGAAVVAQTSGSLDDGGWGSIPVGFNFSFFGTNYNTINIGTNGTVMFGAYNSSGLADFTYTTLPNTLEPFNLVAVLAMDNHLTNYTTPATPGGTLKYWTEGIAPNRRFVVSYENVREYGDSKVSSAQAVFYETTGVIEVHVQSSTNIDQNKLVGVNNGDGTIGVLAYASGTTASATNPIASPFAYRFTPPANYNTTWTATDANGTTTIASGTNIFSQTVAPTITTTYSISYTNQTTGCANAPGSAQVLMTVLNANAPAGVNTIASSNTICLGETVALSMDYTGIVDGLTFQWQSSIDNGTTWQNINGATATTVTVGPTVSTKYRCQMISCAGTPGYSSVSTVAFTNNIASTTSATRCGPGTVSIAATANTGATIKWYAAQSGGTAIGTGSPFTTPINTTSAIYYASAETIDPITSNVCASPRVAVPVTVTPTPALTLSSASTSICVGTTATTPITLLSSPSDFDTYTWSPTTGITGNASTGWIFNPSVSTNYTLTATQTSGNLCISTTNYSFVILPLPSIDTATASATIACAGSIINLAATSSGVLPGTSTVSGTGTSYTSSFGYPTFFGNYWYQDWSQMVYTAAELQAMGLSEGDITSITFNIGALPQPDTVNGYSIRLGATANNTLSGFQTTGLTTVFGPVNYTVSTSGDITINFTTPYNWDGTSNIIVDVRGTGAFDNANATTQYSTTTGNTVVSAFSFSNNSAFWSSNPTATTSTRRPNIKLGGQILSNTTADYTWTWSDGTSTVLTSASGSVTLPASATTTYTVTATNVVAGCSDSQTVTVSANPLPTAPSTVASSHCGTQVPTASVSDTNSFTTPTYKWYDAATAGNLLQTGTATTFGSTVSVTTTLYVSVINPTTLCESLRTPVTVTVTPAPAFSISSSGATICNGQSTALVTATGTSSFDNFVWSPATGVTGNSTSGWIFNPTTSTNYTLTASQSSGSLCANTASYAVIVNPIPEITLVTPSTLSACAGSPIQLSANIIQNVPGEATLGSGSSTGTSYDAIFYHPWGGNKVQYLITAAELTALGIREGNITALGIDMSSVTTQSYDGFAVSIASTSNTNMSTGINSTASFGSVYSSASYTPITGVNTFNFTTPYNWDGSSNIIIQFCWSNNNFGGQSNYAKVDAQSYVSTAYYRADNLTPAEICGGTTATGTTSNRPMFIFNAVVESNVNSNYAWVWSDGTSTVLTGEAGIVTMPSAATTTYTVTATDLVTGCTNIPNSAQVVASLVSTTAPAGVTTIAPSSICFGEPVNLSISYTGIMEGLVFQWQSSVDNGTTWVDIATATGTSITVSQIVPTKYRCQMISCAGTPGYSSVATVVFTNNITSTSDATRCGTGIASIFAFSSAGSTVNWYAANAGGIPLSSGIEYITPSITSTTTYYAAAQSTTPGSSTLGAGGTTSVSTAASFLPGGWGGAKTQYIIKASELAAAGLSAGAITSIGFEPTDSGQTYQGFNVSIGHTSVTSAPTTTFIPNAGLSLVYAGTQANGGFTPTANTVNNLAFGTGTGTSNSFNWDGTSNVVVSISWSRVPGAFTATGTNMKVDNVGFVSSAFRQRDNITPAAMANETSVSGTGSNRPKFSFNGQVICASPRVPVTVTVTPAPALTLSSASASICTGSATAPITATGASNYNTFVWSPATGVSGNSTTGWIFNPTATTTYTLTASQSAGSQCAITTTFTVNVNPLPTNITITPANPSACVGVVLPLTTTGGVFSSNAFAESMDVLPTNFVSSANATFTNNTDYYLQGNGSSLFTTASTSATATLALNQNIDLTGAASASVTFSHIAATEAGWDFGYVEYSTNGGSTWTTFTPANYVGSAATTVFNANARFTKASYTDWNATFTSATSTPGAGPATSLWKTETFNIPAAALTSSQFRVRFRYTTDSSVNYMGWFIDDFKVVKSQSNITWSPVTNLYTNAAATVPYTAGTSASTIYVLPTTVAPLTYVATSTNGSSGCISTASITVRDAVAPVVVTRPVTVQLNAAGAATVTAAQVNNGSTDNCSIATTTVSPSSFTCANVGPNTVTLTVTDASGNTSTGTAVVTVQDLIAPTVITRPITVLLNANGQASITAAQINNGSTDNCGVNSVTVSPSTFTCANLGPNTVTLTVTDVNGNTATGTAIVTVSVDFSTTGDNDLDGMPDNCDPDDDNDGILDTNDNCPKQANTNQADNDNDGLGDACDNDDDNDGVLDGYDNCPMIYNPDQSDIDNDGLGDICDTVEINVSQAITPDGDGVNDTWFINNIENHPNNIVKVYNRWGDLIFSKKGYQNDWNGSYVNNGNNSPDASSYYYQIDLDGNGSIDQDGWIYITK